MRQEVRALVVLTYDANANLSKEELAEFIRADVSARANFTRTAPGYPVETVKGEVIAIREEAEIYGSEA